MGTCGYQEQRPPINKVEKFFGHYLHDSFVTASPRCDRFGEIQSLRTKKDGIYRLIMAAKLGKHTVKMDTVSVECRIMNSLADFELYDGANFELQSILAPIIDHYDRNHQQVYFHVNTAAKHNYLTKIIKFDSFRDVKLKQGLYEISLHKSMPKSQLVDHFIMSRGTMNALVMIFKYFQTSLLDIMQYRKQAQDYGWNEVETMYIWMKVIKAYRELRENNIYHRDIRLSNIFYTPANTNEPLHFLNLISARRISTTQLVEEERELMTVRGVNCFAQSLKGNIQAGQELADYDPHRHDLACLQRVLLSILSLDPLEKTKQCSNNRLGQYLTKLRTAKGTNELSEIQNSIQSFLSSSGANLNLIMDTDKQISQDLSKKLLPAYHRDLIPKIYLNHLLLLHKRQIFNKYLLQKIEQNERQDKKELNLGLLHQIGEYYQSIGIPDNDYYKEEIVLVLDLAKEFRLEHFMEAHEEYIEKAMILMEKYRYKGEDLRIRLKNQVVYSCLEAGDINQANQQLNALLNMAHKENTLELQYQAEVFLTKAMVETTCHMWESAEVTLEKAGIIINQNRNFVTQNEANRMKGDLLMLEGYHYLRYLKEKKDEVPKPKYLGLAQTSITGAIRILTNLPETPTNTIRIIDAYLLQAGLEIQRERYTDAKKSLDGATLLLEQLSTKHTISMSLRRIVYEKLKFVTSPTDPSYNTVCRRLSQYSDTSLSNAETHLRLMSQLNESKRQQRHLRKLEKSIIINQQPQERQSDPK